MLKSKQLKFSALIVFICFCVLEISLRIFGSYYYHQKINLKNKITFEKNEIRVLCLGESTTALGGKHSYPAQLQKLLGNKSNRVKKKYTIINGGLPGTNSRDILDKLDENLETYKPHYVVTMVGINDAQYVVENLLAKNFLGMSKSFFSDLRVFKLLTLGVSFLNKSDRINYKENQSAELTFLRQLKDNPYHELANGKLGLLYYRLSTQTKSDEFKAKAYPFLSKYEELGGEDTRILLALISVHIWKKDFKRAAKLLKPIMDDGNSLEILEVNADLLFESEKFEEAYEVIKKAALLFPNHPVLAQKFSKVCPKLDRCNEQTKLFSRSSIKGIQPLLETENSIQNYRKIVKKIIKSGAISVGMQYPVRNISRLTKALQGLDVKFVSNEEPFLSFVRSSSYEKVFTDKFAGDFGHATKSGNFLIAMKLAEKIRSYEEEK